MTIEKDENVGLAFGLTVGAGMATALGAAVVFVPSLIHLASRRTLAGALGFSAGVMTYVSFVEIFNKSRSSFQESGMEDEKAYAYATVCFFGGVGFMVALNHLVTLLLGGHHHHHHHDDPISRDTRNESRDSSVDGRPSHTDQQTSDAPMTCPCCSDDPVADLQTLQDMAAEMERVENCNTNVHPHAHDDDEEDEEDGSAENSENRMAATRKEEDAKKLMRMSVNTAIAIGLHNFPEGLATFVATLNDPGVGLVLAVAIAIHNIPEGLCVAMPIYYATGNRWKAFGWALFSGLAEPIAALLGWLVLANSFSDQLYAVLFGMVAGMMVIISTRELLPTAHRYDPDDTVVTYSFMTGMAVIALSLVLFVL